MQRHRLISSHVSPHRAPFLLVLWSALAVTTGALAHAEEAGGQTALVAQPSANLEDPLDSDRVEAASVLASRAPAQTFGWIEKVILSPELNWMLDAKLDTGADTSSLDAVKVKRVRYKGKSYVRFSIRNPETGELVSLRRPYVRTVRIRRHSGNHQRRRVVLMSVCLGNVERTIEVTLTDREYFDYPMLLGRSALAGVGVVDPMLMNTAEPNCKKYAGHAKNESPENQVDQDANIEQDKKDSERGDSDSTAFSAPVRRKPNAAMTPARTLGEAPVLIAWFQRRSATSAKG